MLSFPETADRASHFASPCNLEIRGPPTRTNRPKVNELSIPMPTGRRAEDYD